MSANQDQEYISLLRQINDPLVARGRFIAPNFVQNQAAKEVEVFCQKLDKANQQEAKDLLDKIDRLIVRHWFHPLVRAFTCHRANELPYLQELSHFLERANLHYYRQDYLSTVLILVPVVEGLILRHMNYQAPAKQIKIEQMKQFLKDLKSNHSNSMLNRRMEIYRDYLIEFLDSRFFLPSKDAVQLFDESVLNRHYILHQLGNEPFYLIHDCHTMFQLIDLYLELIACQTNKSTQYCWIPEKDVAVLMRTQRYWSIILSNYLGVDDQAADESLLTTHKHYHPMQIDSNYLAVQENQELLMLTQGLMASPTFVQSLTIQQITSIPEKRRELFSKAFGAFLMVRSLNNSGN